MDYNLDIIDELRMHILPYANDIMKEHSVEVFHALGNVFEIMHDMEYRRMSSVNSKVKHLLKNGDSREIILGKCLEIIIDNPFENPEVFYELFKSVCFTKVDEYICFIYFRSILLIMSSVELEIREKIILSLLPENDRERYRRIQQKRR